jgi:hypothetical protein
MPLSEATFCSAEQNRSRLAEHPQGIAVPGELAHAWPLDLQNGGGRGFGGVGENGYLARNAECPSSGVAG